jgi:hypothetical protein
MNARETPAGLATGSGRRAMETLPDILVIHRQNGVDWGWSDSQKHDSFHLTAGVDGGGQTPQQAPDAWAGNGRGAEAQAESKAFRPGSGVDERRKAQRNEGESHRHATL